MKFTGGYKTDTFPYSRITTIDMGAAALKKHHIKALIELDVTNARRKIQELKRDSVSVSFNAWLIKCISQAVEEFKPMHGIRKGKRQIVVFDDIDISIMVEREIEGVKVPLPYVIRKTAQKSLSEIYHEIRGGKEQTIKHEGDYVLGERKKSYLMKAYYSMPGIVRKFIWNYILQNPFLMKQTMGTVLVTAAGMSGRVKGWAIPASVHPLCVAVGSIVKKPGVIDEKIEIREYLYLTVLVDHDVVDGAPAVRALSRLTELVESGFGL